MITSHELARMLLARREHTLYIEILLDDDPDMDDAIPYSPEITELRDVEGLSTSIPSKDLLEYDSENDRLILKAGVIVTPRVMEGFEG